ncbi:MAG: hypothetical protein ABR503_03650 [Chitinophagaceae bacterium]
MSKNIFFAFQVVLLSQLCQAQSATTTSSELLRLSKVLQFETISYYDSTLFKPAPYKNFIACLEVREIFQGIEETVALIGTGEKGDVITPAMNNYFCPHVLNSLFASPNFYWNKMAY